MLLVGNMERKRCHKSYLFAVLFAFALGACGGAQLPKAKCEVAGLKIKLVASDRMNMDEGGNSLPTTVHLFQMKTEAAIKNADFEAMWQTPKEALGEDFLSMTELTLFPSQTEQRELAIESEAGYVAVMGVFRRQTGTTWRLWKPIKAATVAECSISKEPMRQFTFFLEDYHIRTDKR